MKNKRDQRPKTPVEIKQRQDEALRRVRSLKKRPKSFLKKMDGDMHLNLSRQKTPHLTPQQKYSIQKLNEDHDINFMSQNIKTKELQKKNCAKAKLQRYCFQAVIGFGMFGKVWRAKDKLTQKLYAIKQISKPLVISKNGLATTMNERQLLPKICFHLIPGLLSAFQNQFKLYIVLPLLERGDLRYHITKFKYFSESVVRFFAACLVSILDHLRSIGIIHRDIKPQNLLLDNFGYLHLTDFGISQRIQDARSGNCCGTPAYMAPQVMFEKEYGYQSDYYAMGVFLYQMMKGERPFIGSRRQELKKQISKHSAHIKKDEIPEGWSIESVDFINKLLHRNPHSRLGAKGIKEIKQHPWLKYFPWKTLLERQIKSPYNEEFKHWEVNYGQMSQIQKTKQIRQAECALKKGDMQELFEMFTYERFEKSTEWTTKPSAELRLSNF